jgi:hypothetical protein
MPDKKQRSVFRKLGDLLEARIDVPAFVQDLLLQPDACSRVSRRSFGYTPAIIGPARLASSRTRARLLPFPATDPKPPKAM